MLRNTSLLVIGSLASQALALVVQVVLAHRFGTGPEVDAYVAAFAFPALLEAFVLAGLLQLLLPTLVIRFGRGEAQEAWRVLATLLTLLGGGLLVLALPVALARDYLIMVVAPGLEASTRQLGADYLAVIFPGLSFGVAAALLTQAYHAKRRFGFPALLGVLSQAVPLVAVLALSHRIGLWSLILGGLAAKFVVLIPLGLVLVRRGAALHPRLEVTHPDVRRMAWLVLPVMVAAASSRLNGVVDRFFVSFLGPGKLAALGYADRVVSLVLAVLVSPITAVLYPTLADYEARRDRRGLFRAIDRGLRAVVAGMLPVAIAIATLAPLALAIFFEHGRFSSADTVLVSGVLACYGLVFVLGGVGSLVVRGFYTVNNTRDPMIWGGLVPIVFNVVMDALVFRRFGVYGIAAVTSLNMMLAVPVLYILLRRRLEAERIAGWTSFLMRAALSGAVMSAVLLAGAGRIDAKAGVFEGAFSLALVVSVGFATYLACSLWLRLEPVPEIAARCLVAIRQRYVTAIEAFR
jgi:putative peptidoglycan lipid II flippase